MVYMLLQTDAKTMSAAYEMSTQSESESESEPEYTDAPDMSVYIATKNELKQLNTTRKELLETLKRKADELEDYMESKNTKKICLNGLVAQIKTSKKTPWNEKALREHVDEDGKVDIDVFKSSQTVLVERLVIKTD